MKKRIIYGVLNWGLGHASRSSVLIEALQSLGYEVVIASDGAAGEWLQQRFPHCPYRKLPSYRIRYSAGTRQTEQMLALLPQIHQAQREERRLARQWAREEKPEALISDNRLGFCSSARPSIYLSHQMRLSAGILSGAATAAHRYFMRPFRQIWIPDYRGEGLAGKLSRCPNAWEKRCHYLGPLSHLAAYPLRPEPGAKTLILLSGPEPQRSLLEAKILEQIPAQDCGRYLLVRGTEAPVASPIPEGLEYYHRLDSEALAALVASASIILSRAGYSSLMDYHLLGKKALIIPTPGQGEQEYLAHYWSQKNYFHAVEQDELRLEPDLALAAQKPGWPAAGPGPHLAPRLLGLLEAEAKT